MSNGQIQKRIIPDVTRILEENPDLNVTVALGIDGVESDHDKIRQKPGSWKIAIDTARQLQEMKKQFPRLNVQTCTCLMNSNQDSFLTGMIIFASSSSPTRSMLITSGRPRPNLKN